MDESRYSYDLRFLKGSVMTYRKAINLMSASWENVMGVPLDVGSRQPREAFEYALSKFEKMIEEASDDQKEYAWKSLGEEGCDDLDARSLIIETINTYKDDRSIFLDRDMDFVPPKICLDIMRDFAISFVEYGRVTTVSLREYLVEVMRHLSPQMKWNPPLKVGNNRHFPRIWQWFSELSEQSSFDGDYGIRAMNKRGRVPLFPDGPGDLRVRINPDLL